MINNSGSAGSCLLINECIIEKDAKLEQVENCT